MKRPVLVVVLSVLFAVVLIGGAVGEAAAQPEAEPTPIAEPAQPVPDLSGLADVVAEPESGEEPDDEGGEDDGGGPSLFERALCGISPALCATAGLAGIPSPGEALADLGEAAADSILDKLATSMTDAVTWALDLTLGWWIGNDSLIGEEQATMETIGGQFAWVGGALVLLGILWQAIRLVVTRSAQVLADMAGGLATMAFVSAAGWGLVVQFSDATDAWAASILSSGIDSAAASTNMAATLATLPPAASILFGALFFIASLVQAVLMLIRDVAAVLLAALLPFVASARMFGFSRSWLPKVVNALASIILYKPIAAATLYGALTLFSQAQTARAMIAGGAMLVLSIFILPALMRLFAFHDVGGGIVSGGGGGRALATGGVIAAGAVLTGGGSAALGAAAKGGAAATQAGTAAPRVRVQDSTGAAPYVPPAPTNRWSRSGQQWAPPRIPKPPTGGTP